MEEQKYKIVGYNSIKLPGNIEIPLPFPLNIYDWINSGGDPLNFVTPNSNLESNPESKTTVLDTYNSDYIQRIKLLKEKKQEREKREQNKTEWENYKNE